MKRIFLFLLCFVLGASCEKESTDDISILTSSPWKIDKFIKTLYINNTFDTSTVMQSDLCNYYGTIHLNTDYTGKIVSICGNEYSGLWTYKEKEVGISFLISDPYGLVGFSFQNGIIKHISKSSLRLERTYTMSGGINPDTNKEDTLMRIEELVLSR